MGDFGGGEDVPIAFSFLWNDELTVVSEDQLGANVSHLQRELRRVLMLSQMVAGKAMPQTIGLPLNPRSPGQLTGFSVINSGGQIDSALIANERFEPLIQVGRNRNQSPPGSFGFLSRDFNVPSNQMDLAPI